MYIVKDLNDFDLNSKERAFVDFIKENVRCYAWNEKIENPDYTKIYNSPHNEELVPYNNLTPCARIKRLSARKAYKN